MEETGKVKDIESNMQSIDTDPFDSLASGVIIK